MWNVFRPKPERASEVMRRYARMLMDDMKQHLSLDDYAIWLDKPTLMRNLGMEIQESRNDEYYVTCCFRDKIGHFGGSNVATSGTKEELRAWFTDDRNLEHVAIILEDLYMNTHTWD